MPLSLPRPSLRLLVLSAVALASSVYAAFSAPLGGDYPQPPSPGHDFAGAPIRALSEGHITQFFHTQPMMGSVTLLLRAPFVAAARALHLSLLWEYRVGCLACLLVAAGLVGWLTVLLRVRGRGWLVHGLFFALILAGPVSLRALYWGHPEEVVAALLSVVAVVLAGRGRVTVAGVCLGLAVATKQWSILAVLPALVAAPRQRVRLALSAALPAGLLIAPMFIGDPHLFVYQNVHAGLALADKVANITPTNLWFGPFAQRIDLALAPHVQIDTPFVITARVSALSHPVAMVLGFGVPLVYWRYATGRGRPAEDALLLLAVVYLIRCLFDTLTISYHHTPFFVALLTWEMFQRRRLPYLSLISAAALYGMGRFSPQWSSIAFNRIYLLWALPVFIYMFVRLCSSDMSLAPALDRLRRRPLAPAAPLRDTAPI